MLLRNLYTRRKRVACFKIDGRGVGIRRLSVIFAAAVHLTGAPTSASAEGVNYQLLPEFGVPVGATFPLDNLVDPTGNQLQKKQLLGKRLLINFYTIYCAPCIKEVPKLNQIKNRRDDINVLAITSDSAATAAAYVKKYGLNWPIAANARALLFDQLDVQAFPAFALLDADGRLLATVQANQLGGEDGHATVDGIEAWIDAHEAAKAD
jgi:peroxiredoxin